MKSDMNQWDRIKQLLASRISGAAFENWLQRTTFLRVERDTLWVAVPDNITREWMQREFAEEVSSAAAELALPIRQVAYQIMQTGAGGVLSSEGDVVFSPSIN